MITSNSTICLLLAAVGLSGLGGCQMSYSPDDPVLRVDGQVYPINGAGQLELSETQLSALEAEGQVVRIKHVAPENALVIDPQEMSLLLRNRDLFYTELNQPGQQDQLSVLIRKGSLRENMIRNVGKSGEWQGLKWCLDVDYYIPEPFAVIGRDLPAVVMDVLNDYPVFVKFDEQSMMVRVYAAGSHQHESC